MTDQVRRKWPGTWTTLCPLQISTMMFHLVLRLSHIAEEGMDEDSEDGAEESENEAVDSENENDDQDQEQIDEVELPHVLFIVGTSTQKTTKGNKQYRFGKPNVFSKNIAVLLRVFD